MGLSWDRLDSSVFCSVCYTEGGSSPSSCKKKSTSVNATHLGEHLQKLFFSLHLLCLVLQWRTAFSLPNPVPADKICSIFFHFAIFFMFLQHVLLSWCGQSVTVPALGCPLVWWWGLTRLWLTSLQQWRHFKARLSEHGWRGGDTSRPIISFFHQMDQFPHNTCTLQKWFPKYGVSDS